MSNIDFLCRSRDLFDKRLSARFGQPTGASECEISELEKALGFRLPQAYRQYLFWMGKDKFGALKGSEWFIDDVQDNEVFLEEFLYENSVKNVNAGKKVCFFSHQGYMAAWFLADDAECDPKCQFYSEFSSDIVSIDEGTFSQFLLKELRGVAKALEIS